MGEQALVLEHHERGACGHRPREPPRDGDFLSLSAQFLDELRSRTLLSALIGRSVKLQRAGREFKACCPFHDEKSASFYVNDDKAFYHCFGCGAHGDAIRFLTDSGGLAFMDAVKELAAAAGMTVPAPDPRAQEKADRLAPLYDVMARAVAFYAGHRETRAAMRYLEQRGVAPETAQAFCIGFAPDGGQELRAALGGARGEHDGLLIEAGLLVKPDDDRDPYDRFRARLIFPIFDARGRAIALGGRRLDAGEPKYLNSPETPLFNKGRSLFNIQRAAAASRKTGRLIVVEGYMDVIGLAGAGVDDVVAPNGTAVTEAQLEIMWRLAESPVLCFDGDHAGQRAGIKAALRALPMLEPGRTLQFVALPAGKDPDDIVREHGAGFFDGALRGAEQLVALIWRHELAATKVASPEARAGLRSRLAEHANAIKSGNVRQLYLAEFKARFERQFNLAPRGPDTSRSAPPPEGRWRKPARASSDARAIADGALENKMMRAILAGLLRFPDMAALCAEQLVMIDVGNPRFAELLDALMTLAFANPKIAADELPEALEQRGLGGAIAALTGGHRLPFTFVTPGSEDAQARRDLEEAIGAQVAH